MSCQQEVLLWTKNARGERIPFVCEHCGKQRVGVVLNIVTKALLDCECVPKIGSDEEFA